jgi:hypothetical protein
MQPAGAKIKGVPFRFLGVTEDNLTELCADDIRGELEMRPAGVPYITMAEDAFIKATFSEAHGWISLEWASVREIIKETEENEWTWEDAASLAHPSER